MMADDADASRVVWWCWWWQWCGDVRLSVGFSTAFLLEFGF
jgi:hypothetical protein